MQLLYSVLPLVALAFAIPSPLQDVLEERATGSLSSWLASQSPIALQGILDNVGSSGSKVSGASPGVIVASPSKSNPDYFFTW